MVTEQTAVVVLAILVTGLIVSGVMATRYRYQYWKAKRHGEWLQDVLDQERLQRDMWQPSRKYLHTNEAYNRQLNARIDAEKKLAHFEKAAIAAFGKMVVMFDGDKKES